MTVPTWPDTLPQRFLVNGNQEATGDGRLRSPTDTGPGKVRRRSSAVVNPLGGTLRMNAAQLAIFDGFIDSDIAGGSLPFNFPAPYGAGTWLVQIGDTMPSRANVGGDRWNVTLALEVLP